MKPLPSSSFLHLKSDIREYSSLLTELSKKVRDLKKEKKIQGYSIDQNGKFFVKKNGQDSSYEFFSCEDIQKLVRES